MWPCKEKRLGCFLHFLDSFLPEIQRHISFNREIAIQIMLLLVVCFFFLTLLWCTNNCRCDEDLLFCVLFYLKKKKRDWFSLLLRLDVFNMKQACQKQGCLTSNTNDDCNLNEFYTEEITAVLRSKLQRKKKIITMNFVCLASAENEWLCSGKEKKTEARKLQLIIS